MPEQPAIPTLPLASGGRIPQLGLGTYRIVGPGAAETIASAIGLGYRLIDTAAMYDNEEAVGEAVRRSGVPRDEFVVTTKIGAGTAGAKDARDRARLALDRLGLDRIDLLLSHGPHRDEAVAVDTWAGLLALQADGVAAAVGVSNYSPRQLTRLHDATGVWPAVNQVQVSPALQRRDAVDFHARHGIVTEAWSPLGVEHGVLEHPVVRSIADARGVSPALIALRWGMQRGLVVIPKASTPERQRENLGVAQLVLDEDESAALAALDVGEQSAWEARGFEAW